MTTPSQSPPRSRRSHPPLWLVEGLDVVEQRRSSLITVTAGVVLVAVVLAFLAPGIVPPTPLVGAAVGLAAVLLGLAVAIALDAADLRLRGPRHVGAAGGELVAVLPTVADGAAATTLATAVLEAREPGTPLLLGLAASGRDVRPTVAWTDALAIALEAEGVSVLRIDLASGHSPAPGLVEVVRDGVKLANAVSFGPEPRLARLGAGADHGGALEVLTELPSRLPRDLDVLLVALPMAASRQVVAAVRSLDHVLIVAQRDRTSRVELIAGLDALESAGTRAQVALLDDLTAARLAPSSPIAVAAPPAVDDNSPDAAASDDVTPDGVAPEGAAPDVAADDPDEAESPKGLEVQAPDDDLLDRLVGAAGGQAHPGTADAAPGDAPDPAEGDDDHARDDDIDPVEAAVLRAETTGGVGGAAIAAAMAAEAFGEHGSEEPDPAPPAQEPDPALPASEESPASEEPPALDEPVAPESEAEAQPDENPPTASVAPVEERVSSDPRPLDVVDGVAREAALALALTPEVPPTLPDAEPDADVDQDPTDEIAPVDPAISRSDSEHDDLLRTTAQLSVLMDGLEQPDDDERGPAS